MSTGKRFVPTSEQKVQVHDILDRLKELQRDPAVWKAFLDEQRILLIASELHAKKWGDPCEGTVVMLKPADMPTQDRPPHRHRSRTRSEPPRVLRRLNSLRGLSHEQVEQVLTRGP